ncbi:hypothetical protein OB915_23380, partial [Klebsiella pneumoniae]|nr:hypothetical protein [Klebsiella pneumoniae]
MRLSSCNIFDDQDDKSRTHCLRLYSGWFQFRYDNGRAKSEMPGSIDKAPRHDEATGWSSTAISYQRGEADLKWFTEFGHLNRGDMLTS